MKTAVAVLAVLTLPVALQAQGRARFSYSRSSYVQHTGIRSASRPAGFIASRGGPAPSVPSSSPRNRGSSSGSAQHFSGFGSFGGRRSFASFESMRRLTPPSMTPAPTAPIQDPNAVPGALIKTAHDGFDVEPGGPFRTFEVDAGATIDASKAQSIGGKGLFIGPPDLAPGSNGSASGNNSITPVTP